MKAVSNTWPTGARRRCQVGVGVARRAQPRVLITSLTPAWWRASVRALVSVTAVLTTWNTEVDSAQSWTTQSHRWNDTGSKGISSEGKYTTEWIAANGISWRRVVASYLDTNLFLSIVRYFTSVKCYNVCTRTQHIPIVMGNFYDSVMIGQKLPVQIHAYGIVFND